MLAPVYLTYRTYQVFLGRIEDQRRHVEETQKLHSETIEALLQARRAERALADEKERLAVTLRSIGDGVITTDLDGNVLSINNVAETLTGWTQEEAAGKPFGAVFRSFDPETRERLRRTPLRSWRGTPGSPASRTARCSWPATSRNVRSKRSPRRFAMPPAARSGWSWRSAISPTRSRCRKSGPRRASSPRSGFWPEASPTTSTTS